MSTFDPLTSGYLLALAGLAAASDMRSHRIPNWLVAAGLLLALALQMTLHGPGQGAQAWLTGALAGFAPYLALYLLGAVGAGDAKLMAGIGAFAGPQAALEIAIASFAVGGLLALAVMLMRKRVRKTLSGIGTRLLWLPLGLRANLAGRDKLTTAARLPYAVAIAGGVVLVMTGVL
ncbi:A24 family peptidase [Cupriavidus basilensis]|uniref:A24 family peptidase n=1 Tax=Cupriavidus basilensis TaxID=68895 RepID=UPI0007517F1B|nr:prepilin peptidase [Cupriavidus basilensis]